MEESRTWEYVAIFFLIAVILFAVLALPAIMKNKKAYQKEEQKIAQEKIQALNVEIGRLSAEQRIMGDSVEQLGENIANIKTQAPIVSNTINKTEIAKEAAQMIKAKTIAECLKVVNDKDTDFTLVCITK